MFYDLAEDDFISGWYNVTFLPDATHVKVNISLKVDDVDEETENFMLYIYVPSAAYEVGVQPGSITEAVAIIYRPGM